MPFLGVNKSVNLISLDVIRMEVTEFGVKQRKAFLPDCQRQRHDSVLVDSGYPGNASDGHAFHKQSHDLNGLVNLNGMTA